MIQRNEANLHKNWQKELANGSYLSQITLLEMVKIYRAKLFHENDLKARSLFADARASSLL